MKKHWAIWLVATVLLLQLSACNYAAAAEKAGHAALEGAVVVVACGSFD